MIVDFPMKFTMVPAMCSKYFVKKNLLAIAHFFGRIVGNLLCEAVNDTLQIFVL